MPSCPAPRVARAGQLHDQLHQRHPDGQRGGVDDRRQQPSKTYGQTAPSRAPSSPPAAWSTANGDRRDPDQHAARRRRRGCRLALSPSCPAPRWARSGQLHDQLHQRHPDGQHGGVDDRRQQPSKTYGQTATFAGTEFTTSGLVNGDTVTSVSLTSSGAAATATVAARPMRSCPAPRSARAWAITRSATSAAPDGQRGGVDVRPANDQTKTYGRRRRSPARRVHTSGLVNGDTVTSVT